MGKIIRWMNLIFALLLIVVLSAVNLQQIRLYLSFGIMIMLVMLIHFYRKFITKPLIEFENKLEKIAHQIKEIDNDRVELRSFNEELEATYGQLVAMEQEVSRQKQNFEALFKNSKNAIVMFDQEHRVLDINQSFTKLFGYTLEEVKGIHLDAVVITEDHKSETAVITKTVFDSSVEKYSTLEAIRYGKDGKPLQVSIQIIPIMDEYLTIGGYGIYTDISERKHKEASLAYMSTHDELTGLYNRSYFERYMEILKVESNLPIGIMMVDVNGLKLINDAFGYKAGDGLLVLISEKLRGICTRGELIARMGGDEFCLLIKNTNSIKLEEISKNIMEKCNDIKVHEVSISVCVGYAQLHYVTGSYAKVIKDAEDNLNKRKLTEAPSVQGKAIYTIIKTLHEKNKREEQHSKRVSELSFCFGKALNLTEREISELKTIGLLHDVGKIALDENLLNKEGKLTPEEYEEIKNHPAIGYRILSTVNEMCEIADYILAHHESYDGSGYPKGLKGEEIPYLSRIITVIDAFDAMTSDRPYRKAMTYQEAYTELRRVSGSQFDTDIVKSFIAFMEGESELQKNQVLGWISNSMCLKIKGALDHEKY